MVAVLEVARDLTESSFQIDSGRRNRRRTLFREPKQFYRAFLHPCRLGQEASKAQSIDRASYLVAELTPIVERAEGETLKPPRFSTGHSVTFSTVLHFSFRDSDSLTFSTSDRPVNLQTQWCVVSPEYG